MNTYSFSEVDIVLSNGSVGMYSANGEGMGTVAINMTADRTVQEASADGTIMTSKIKDRRGTIALTMQQTSPFNQFMIKWFNYLELAPASEWANSVLLVKSRSTNEMYNCKGAAPTKLADKSYQAQGQMVTWNLMAADIQQDII